jgi:hypothetical protein
MSAQSQPNSYIQSGRVRRSIEIRCVGVPLQYMRDGLASLKRGNCQTSKALLEEIKLALAENDSAAASGGYGHGVSPRLVPCVLYTRKIVAFFRNSRSNSNPRPRAGRQRDRSIRMAKLGLYQDSPFVSERRRYSMYGRILGVDAAKCRMRRGKPGRIRIVLVDGFQARVPRFPHLAHASSTDRCEDFVRAEFCPRGKRHRLHQLSATVSSKSRKSSSLARRCGIATSRTLLESLLRPADFRICRHGKERSFAIL